jgi:hypothetical protein
MRREFRDRLAALRRQTLSAVGGKSDNFGRFFTATADDGVRQLSRPACHSHVLVRLTDSTSATG